MNRTYSPKASEIDRAWHVVDAAGVPLGRLSSTVARLLMGKHKPTYARHLDTGDFVVVINAKKTLLTGRKEEQKVYYSHTGRPGSLRSETAAERRAKHPRRLIESAVKGMLPKTKLGRAQFKKLKVYGGAEHKHEAQQPVPFDVAAAL